MNTEHEATIALDGDASLFPMQPWPLDKSIDELTRNFDLRGFTLHLHTFITCEPQMREITLDVSV
jgi:hypothetical protein